MKKTNKHRKNRRITVFSLVNGFFLLLAAFLMLYPLWYVVTGSFMKTSETVTNIFHFWVRDPSMEGYQTIFSSYDIGTHFLASVYSSGVGMVLSLAATTLAAYALSRPELPGKGIMMRLVLGAMLFSGGMIPTYMVVRYLGMINTWEALFIPGLINLFYLIIMRTYFHGVSDELLDAARIDGAGEWRILLTVVIPISMPILASISLFYLVDRWNDFMSGIIYINDPNKQPLQAMLQRIVSTGDTGTSPVSSSSARKVNSAIIGYAATVVTVMPILMIYPFLQKYFVHGMMIGSMKG